MNAKLFVRNLSWSVKEEDLYGLFSEAGEVLSVVIPTRREDGKPRGFAFVEMASADEAQQSIKRLNGTILKGRDIVVDVQSEKRPLRSDNHAVKNAKLFVRNISYSVSESDLTTLFQQVGRVLTIRIPTDRDTGAQKPFGFVEMGSADEAERAINQLGGTSLQGQEIAIDYQDENRSKGSPRPGNRFNPGGYGRERSEGYSSRW